jgi:predicted nuclease of predicted toxin-antitoxin system
LARLYANENFPRPVVEELRRLGHDVVTIQETGKAGQAVTDQEVLEYAKADDRAVLTLNRRHFLRLHQENPEHCGIVICSVEADFIGQALRIHNALAEVNPPARVIRVNRPHH